MSNLIINNAITTMIKSIDIIENGFGLLNIFPNSKKIERIINGNAKSNII